ncbi:unnamed protein product [Phytophthora lilii]|uniref:Unnamed protein product n=1 Tax=Phytophthora lilii TaxID=2077276 RepID=A0A9W6TP47_9STRA|nr:unnamed protein product [Phytophthora lilii]
MASPQLLDAAIQSDGSVREVPYTLLCMVVAVEKANEVAPTEDTVDIMKIYMLERDVQPFERVLQAADDFSLQKNVMRDKYKTKRKQKANDEEDEDAIPQASSTHVQMDLERLLRSTSRVETRRKLEDDLRSLRLEQIHELTGVSLPKHLQISPLEEDPLEFRRNTQGVAQVWGTPSRLSCIHLSLVMNWVCFDYLFRTQRAWRALRPEKRSAALSSYAPGTGAVPAHEACCARRSEHSKQTADSSSKCQGARTKEGAGTTGHLVARAAARGEVRSTAQCKCGGIVMKTLCSFYDKWTAEPWRRSLETSFEATRSDGPRIHLHSLLVTTSPRAQFCSSVMVNGARRDFSDIDTCQRQVSADSDSDHSLVSDKVVHAQYERRWHRRTRHRSMLVSRVLLLLLVLCLSPTHVSATSSSINYGTLTWSKWNAIYTAAVTDATAFPRIYRTGPRVRAKLFVATKISMDSLQAGEAILRQRISEFVGVETIERVQLEYLQTDVLSESEQGAYYAALGISALPPPLGSSGNRYDSSASAIILPAIEAERERIALNLRHGGTVNSESVTIDDITLFGTPMRLVDITLDGEAFTQLYLKPWVGLQLAIASTASLSTGVSSSGYDHYSTDRDAFQDLRLRFLLAQHLRLLKVGVSDIIIHSPKNILPFSVYYAEAGVLEIEIHLLDMDHASTVETFLLREDELTLRNEIAAAFNEKEPQWQIIAMDISTLAGELFAPTSQISSALDTRTSVVSAAELTFELYDISLAQLERTKWSVLDFVRVVIAQVTPSRVRFGKIDYPASSSALSSLVTQNDYDESITSGTVAADSIFDPMNAVNWTLSFIVEPETSDTFDSAVLGEHIAGAQGFVEAGLEHALGFTDTSSSRSATFKSASAWVDSEVTSGDAVKPYVLFKLTIKVEPLDASGTILESPNFFQLHHVRCALVLLLQQIAILDDSLFIVSANAVDLHTPEADGAGHSWHRLVYMTYRASISDESQRRGIRSIIFSPRLARTISLYSGRTLELIEREIYFHADGSPVWPENIPGTLFAAPPVDMISDGFSSSSTSSLKQQTSYAYDFNDPEPSASSGALLDATDACLSSGATWSGLCIKLRFTGTTQVAPIFLRKLQSLQRVISSSINLPPMHASIKTADAASSSYPAPWVLVGEQSGDGENSWSFFVSESLSRDNIQSIRLTFGVVDTMQDLSATTPFTIDLELNSNDATVAPVVRRRQFGDLAVVATIDQPAPAFITAELPDLTSNGVRTTGVSVTLNLQEPRLGGLYSSSLLEEVAPSCNECTTLLADCNSRLECRAFSACASVLLDADLTLVSSMLQEDAIGTSVNASWLLEDCLSPSDGTVWSSTMREMLVSSCTCLWKNRCPLAYSETLGRQLVLDYSHGEHVLTFELASGFASLTFVLDVGDDDDDPTTTPYEFMEDFSGDPTSVTAQLDDMLTEMYRAAHSNVATVESTLTTTESTAGVVTAHLTIHYLFLGKLPLPLVQITQSGNSEDASVDVTIPKETLHLVVIPTSP